MKTMTLGMTLLAVILTGCASSSWQTKLQNQIPVLGHRNWIVVADSAYPMQSNPGIETIYTDKGQVEVLEHVLQELENASHVRPVVLVDRELEFVSETDASGVNRYRTRLNELLEGKHEVTERLTAECNVPEALVAQAVNRHACDSPRIAGHAGEGYPFQFECPRR